jgi:hypothetical protein
MAADPTPMPAAAPGLITWPPPPPPPAPPVDDIEVVVDDIEAVVVVEVGVGVGALLPKS